MWIYLTEGALSIVAHRDKPDHLLVRARHPRVIERVFPKEDMYYNSSADYPYRANVPREVVSDFLTTRLSLMQYDNFKNTVNDYDYSSLLKVVWNEGYIWGENHRYNYIQDKE